MGKTVKVVIIQARAEYYDLPKWEDKAISLITQATQGAPPS